MSSLTPLLSRADVIREHEIPTDAMPPQSLDEKIGECLEGFGWRQFLQALIISVAWFFDGQQACISDFSSRDILLRRSLFLCQRISKVAPHAGKRNGGHSDTPKNRAKES